MHRVCVLSTGRADSSIVAPVVRALSARMELRTQVVASGSHSTESVALLQEAIGVPVDIELLPAAPQFDTPKAVVEAAYIMASKLSDLWLQTNPDMLLVVGDRTETLAAASAALVHSLPIAHLHGGEVSYGSTDECCRHAITKLSSLHFVSTMLSAQRVRQLGEDPGTIHVVGAPALDLMVDLPLFSPQHIIERLDLPLAELSGCAVLTYHPETAIHQQSSAPAVDNQFVALRNCGYHVIATMPNADLGNLEVRRRIEAWSESAWVTAAENLGARLFYSLLSHAGLLIGNSSSGIVESSTFGIPTVNVGARQLGRERGNNVFDAQPTVDSIVGAIRLAESWKVTKASKATNPYFHGGASDTIARCVAAYLAADHLPKTFNLV